MASPFGNTGVTNCAICLEGLVFICTPFALRRSIRREACSENLISYAPLAGNLRQALRLNIFLNATRKSSSETTSATSFFFRLAV